MVLGSSERSGESLSAAPDGRPTGVSALSCTLARASCWSHAPTATARTRRYGGRWRDVRVSHLLHELLLLSSDR